MELWIKRHTHIACHVSHPGVRELGEEWFNLEISMKSLDRRLKPYPRPMVCGCAGKPQICRAASCHGLNCSLNHQWRYFAHRRKRQTLCSLEETALGQKKRDNGTRAENGKTRSPTYLQLLGAHLWEWSGFARWPVACGGRSLYAPSLTHSLMSATHGLWIKWHRRYWMSKPSGRVASVSAHRANKVFTSVVTKPRCTHCNQQFNSTLDHVLPHWCTSVLWVKCWRRRLGDFRTLFMDINSSDPMFTVMVVESLRT